jgi:hypothetical protein
MTYYKIIKDGMVVDVNNKFFRYQKKYMNIIQCDPKYAELIQSSDGKTFYGTGWLRPLPQGVSHSFIDAVLISEEEYLQLKEQLAQVEAIMEPVVEETPIEREEVQEIPQETLLTISALYNKIKSLEEEIKNLKR